MKSRAARHTQRPRSKRPQSTAVSRTRAAERLDLNAADVPLSITDKTEPGLFCHRTVRRRTLYKTAVTTRKVLTTGVPAYMKEHLVRHAAARQTRSAARPLLTVPRTNTVC